MSHFWKLVFVCFSLNVAADPIPMPDIEDRVRLFEAFSLSESIGNSIWPGWTETPFVVLLVTPEFEYLVRHPSPPEDFMPLGFDRVLGEHVFARPFSGNFNTSILATFPAVAGVNTVVVGTPENTGKSSTQWVITALHEHFHQLQFTRPWYYDSVDKLDLANGDQTGMWQLNYPFPYKDERVSALIEAYRDLLLLGVRQVAEGHTADPDSVRHMACGLLDQLKPADGRYFSFQMWQEGVARYTEHAVAHFAANRHQPGNDFKALDDFAPYEDALAQLTSNLESELINLDPRKSQRTVFYALGAAQSFLLESGVPGWKERYFAEPFSLGCDS